MENEKEEEWLEAQKIVISKDLVAAAKQQLNFLAAVDRNRNLYHGPALDRAIRRYKYCWLPLLAKYTESAFPQAPLVVPLDCEWIWHCHRLNPVCYKIDCENLYGRILDNLNVLSSVEGTCTKYTEEIWNKIYPNEPYEFKMSIFVKDDEAENILGQSKTTNYDLVSAVKRQIPFFYQVSRPYMNCNLFLEGAVARYKGFLHLMKKNEEMSVKCFCVPTYDIDLIWHSHQLNPASYFKDMMAIVDKVLEHDDTDSDRTKGGKLDVGFYKTTKQWEETFGSRYWRVGAMYRGKAPSSLSMNLSNLDTLSLRKKAVLSKECGNMIQLPKRMLVEVMLEIIAVRNLPTKLDHNIFVCFSKKQPDLLFKNRGRMLSILSRSKEKQVIVFQCEPTGELVIELMSYSSLSLNTSRAAHILGTKSITLLDYLTAASKLPVEILLESTVNSELLGSKPLSVILGFSLTSPIPAPYVLQIVQTRPSLKNSCFFSTSGRSQNAKSWTCVVDEADNELMRIQLRDSMEEAKGIGNHLDKKEVVGVTPSGETLVLAEFVEAGLSLMNSDWFFSLQNKFDKDSYMFELNGSHKVIMIPGRKLEYEIKNCVKDENEQNFITGVEFSTEYPYGKDVALFNLKSGFIEIKEEWLLLPGITSAFIVSEIFNMEAYNAFTTNEKEENFSSKDRVMNIEEVAKKCSGNCGNVSEVQDNNVASKELNDYGDNIVKHDNKYKANWVKCNPCGGYEYGYWHKDRAKSGGFCEYNADGGVYSASCGGCGGGCSSCGSGCQGGGCSGSCRGGGGCSS